MRVIAWVAPLALCAVVPAVHAQSRGHVPQPEDVLPESDLDDPIGVDTESRDLERIAAQRAPKPASDAELAAVRARFGPEPPQLDVRKGEVLTAHPSTREVTHRVHVELDPGLARIDVEMEFEGRASHPSELRYRLAVPDRSELASLEVCNANGCRAGLIDANGGALGPYEAALLARHGAGEHVLPIARAQSLRDARGAAIVVHAAPVADGQPLRVHLAYVSELALHGGLARLLLPARGMDPEAATGEVHVSASRLFDVRVDGQPASAQGASVEPWVSAALSARAKAGEPPHALAWQFSCGAERCARAELWAGPQPAAPVDLVIALDLSPSTEGPARGRLVAAVAGLLAAAPQGSRIRAIGFAARAKALIAAPMDPSQVELAPFQHAVADAELGSATRFEAVWDLARAWFGKGSHHTLRPLIVIVGDGGLTAGEARPFERARAAGVDVSTLNVADRDTQPLLRQAVYRANGIALHAGAEAEAAARGRDRAPLAARLAALFAPTLARVSVSAAGKRVDLGPLRAGELLAWQGSARSFALLRGRARIAAVPAPRELGPVLAGLAAGDGQGVSLLAVDARDLAQSRRDDWPEQEHARGAACDRRGPAHRFSGISSDDKPVGLAEERVCKAPPKAQVRSGNAEIGVGMPADPLLSMLRQRILPIARGCFRRDRAGRPIYEKRAVFVFALAEREVLDAYVEGPISEALRRCLLNAVDTLEVPRFSGTVKVRYPLITQSVPLPEQIELRTETAGTLDRLFPGGEKR